MPKELVFDASKLSVTVTCEKCGVSVTIGPLTKIEPAGLHCGGCNETWGDTWIRLFSQFVKAAKEKNLLLRVPLD